MKALLLSNQSRSMSVFWRVLVKELKDSGIEIVCCVPPGDKDSEKFLKNLGAKIINYNLDRKGLNPLRDLGSLIQLYKIFKAEKPDLVFCTTIKPVIYGSLAAHKAGIKKIFATITGLGYAFENDTPIKRIINRISRLLYRASLANVSGVFFQNRDDAELFHKLNILEKDAPVLFARGTGVDTNYFSPAPFPPDNQPVTFLLVGRLLEAKGLHDFAEAARKLRRRYPDARFQILGAPETGPGSISVDEVSSWNPDVEYLGQTADVRPYIAKAHVIVLPSWREGTPTSLMEAMSMGRPCIATDVPGCREVVSDGKNGFLVPVRDAEALASCMEKFILQPEMLKTMGENGRQLALEKFEAVKVARGIMRDMGIEVKQ